MDRWLLPQRGYLMETHWRKGKITSQFVQFEHEIWNFYGDFWEIVDIEFAVPKGKAFSTFEV